MKRLKRLNNQEKLKWEIIVNLRMSLILKNKFDINEFNNLYSKNFNNFKNLL